MICCHIYDVIVICDMILTVSMSCPCRLLVFIVNKQLSYAYHYYIKSLQLKSHPKTIKIHLTLHTGTSICRSLVKSTDQLLNNGQYHSDMSFPGMCVSHTYIPIRMMLLSIHISLAIYIGIHISHQIASHHDFNLLTQY